MFPEPDIGETSSVLSTLSGPVSLQFEPVGRWYEAYCQRRHHKHSLSQLSLESSSSEDEADDDEIDDENDAHLLGLDPKEWKQQDHYAVLGLGKLRFRATEDQIKRAYKRKVLNHHPDKRKARGLLVKHGDDDYFTCITKAYEILGVRSKRRSFDSVDPDFDDAVPQINANSKDNFFNVFLPVFEFNSRWSKKRRLPKLGDEKSSFDDVNIFYSFWYEFDSWREYSYLDEEEKEKGENREERRWIEKQNKAARQKRKKEEVCRVRLLVDNAYACDPRILKFKEDEKEKKIAQKRAKQDAARARVEEEERKKQEVIDEERKKKEKDEEESKILAAAARKEKEAQKKAFKKERRILRTTMKDAEYFTSDDGERVTNMQEVDRLAELLSLASLQTLNEDLTSGDRGRAKRSFMNQVKELTKQIEREKQQQMDALQKQATASSEQKAGKRWTDQEVQMLIKAVNLFPAGTKDRWEVIANFLCQHILGCNKIARDVLGKAKELQKNDTELKAQAQTQAFQKFEQEHLAHVSTESIPSKRLESVVDQQMRETGTNPAPWTADEQKRLEQALKTYPATTADRWDKVAEVIPSRSKKDCMKRYKELVELIRAKKAAQDAAAKGKKL